MDEILPGFSPCRNFQHPCWTPTSLHDLQAKNQNEEQPLTERMKDPERQLLKTSLQTLNRCSHKPGFCPLIIHQHVHEQLLFTAVCRKQLFTGFPQRLIFLSVVFSAMHRTGLSKAASNVGCTSPDTSRAWL